MTTSRRDLLRASAALGVAHALPREAAASLPEGTPSSPAADWSRAVAVNDFETLAKQHIPYPAWEYIQSGAADEITLRWNREALDRIALAPRVLRDVRQIDTRTELFGQKMDFPVLIAPSALHKNVHPEGELATARGAGTSAATLVLSTLSSYSVEDVKQAASRPVWFQLYVQKDRGFTRHLIQRAEAAGCTALCITVDTPTAGARWRSQRAGFEFPPNSQMPNLTGLSAKWNLPIQRERNAFQPIAPDELTWKDIESLQSIAKVPVVLKGILNPEDALLAAQQGVAGIIVSNHGARNLDTAPATIDALPRVADKVAGRLTVLMDGGIRRGTDVLKALALGAQAVLIGRPVLYGLSVGGAEGVARVVNILRAELEMAMALTGVSSLPQIDRRLLWS